MKELLLEQRLEFLQKLLLGMFHPTGLAVGQHGAERCWHIQPFGIILCGGGSLVLPPETASEVQPVPLTVDGKSAAVW